MILDTAARLFAERGYTAVGIDEIGEAVEASGPSLYWHFPNKQALLEAVAVTASDRIGAAIAATGPDAGFDAVVRAEVGAVLDQPHYARTLMLERHRIALDHPEVSGAEARNMAVAGAALRRLNPLLDDPVVGFRLFTQLGPIAMLTPDRPLSRHRLADLTARSIVALGAAAPVPPVPPAPPAPPAPGGDRHDREPWYPALGRSEAILRAARRLFRAEGYEQVSLHDIAEAAGLSRPSVYHYFRNRAEILDHAWRREMTRFLVGTWDALDAATSAGDALDRLAAAYVRVMLDCVDIMGVIQRRPPDAPELDSSREPERRQVHETWAAVLAELRPDLSRAEASTLVEMAFSVAAWGALAVAGDHAWEGEVAAMMAAFARGS